MTTSRAIIGDLELEVERNWGYVRPFRLFIENFIAVGTRDSDLAQRVAMTVTELFENAVKFGTSDTLLLRVQIRDEGPMRIRVVLENDTIPERISEITSIVHQIQYFQEETENYRESLMNAVEREDLQSKVGLARIRAEGKMDLWVEVEGNRVRFIAERTAVPNGSGAIDPP